MPLGSQDQGLSWIAVLEEQQVGVLTSFQWSWGPQCGHFPYTCVIGLQDSEQSAEAAGLVRTGHLGGWGFHSLVWAGIRIKQMVGAETGV